MLAHDEVARKFLLTHEKGGKFSVINYRKNFKLGNLFAFGKNIVIKHAIKKIKNIKRRSIHFLSYWCWFFGRRNKAQDYYAEAIISIAARWEGEVDPLLTYTAMFDNLRQSNFKGSFWELGGGYSTILAPLSLGLPWSDIHSVDFNPAKYDVILNGKKVSRAFLEKICLHSDISVSYEQVESSLTSIAERIVSYPEERVRQSLEMFAADAFSEYKQLEKIRGRIIDTFKNHPHANEEYRFYEDFEALTGPKLCSKLVAMNCKIDALFLDCGELSSVAEFTLLEPLISNGGYVLLHDIYYPKSIKNYLVATLLVLSEDWEIIYIDRASSQGGLVAKKKHAN